MSRTVWITGAGSGIGAAMARAFAGAGYSVALTARGTGGLETVAAEIAAAGGVATIHEGDVTDRAGMADLAERIAREIRRHPRSVQQRRAQHPEAAAGTSSTGRAGTRSSRSTSPARST